MATIQGIYVALFGRPADPTGLAYFNGVTQNGANLNAIGDLASTQEYKDRFAGQTNAGIVGAIYKSLFNREPEAAGLNFFVDALNKGTLNIKNIAIAILDGAQGSDKTIVDLKVAAANAYTAQLDTPLEVSAYAGTTAANAGRTFLANVTTTAPTTAEVTAAVALLSVGNTISLTAGTDTVSASGAAGFISTTNNDTINAAATQLVSADSIDAGLGVDTLNATSDSGTAVNPTLTSVEKIFYTQTTAGGTLNLSKATGVTEAWNKSSTTALTVSEISKGVTLGVEGTVGAAAAFAFKAADVTGSADAATLALKSAAVTGGITINAIETLNIATSGTASTATIAGDSIKDVKITGDVGGTLTFSSTTLKTVDASAVNGSGVSLNVSAATGGVTVTGSKFGETITLHTGDTTDKDVVVYNAANISVGTAAQQDTIVNFTTGEDKLDLKAFALTGAKATFTNFGGTAPIENQTFLGNAVGTQGNEIYVDANNDGKFNAAVDLVLTVGAGNVAATDIIFS